MTQNTVYLDNTGDRECIGVKSGCDTYAIGNQ